MTITPMQEYKTRNNQAGLDNPANYPEIIVGSFNPFTCTIIYNYGEYRLWYKPSEKIWKVWENEVFCFSFGRETLVADMIKRMDLHSSIRNEKRSE